MMKLRRMYDGDFTDRDRVGIPQFTTLDDTMSMGNAALREEMNGSCEIGSKTGYIKGRCVGVDQSMTDSVVSKKPYCHAGMNGVDIKEPPREMVERSHGNRDRLRYEKDVGCVSDVRPASREA